MHTVVLEPDVAGGWGSHTIADASVDPPLVSRLRCHFDGWLGDDLLESFPCFIATARFSAALERAHLTGLAATRGASSGSSRPTSRSPPARLDVSPAVDPPRRVGYRLIS